MFKCVFLVGVPAAGKSTWMKNQDWVDDTCIISTDTIIEEVASEYGMTYDEAFKNLIGFAEQVMWNDLKLAAEDGDPIYIDRTNLTAKGRKKFIDYLKPFGYEFEAVVFPTPDRDEWERRLNSRPGKTIPEHVLESMERNFQMPLMDEGFSKITTI